MQNSYNEHIDNILKGFSTSKARDMRALLIEACANDDSLMDKLQAIMSDSDIQTLHQATEQNIADWQDLEATITPGEMIGPYKVEHQLGEGGMGVVVKAEQLEPIQRTVAVKIIKQGMSSRQVLRRFQMEQQTLGNMNHPYIAQVYDAGVTPNKRPYFVMEYIQGTPLTHFCDEHKLDLHERLSLFDKVCDGIRYAHQRGIVHRDLKPANILVFESEGKFIPKIIDFGIAKALHTSPEAGQTMLTAWGTTMGSPGYMSPEQARTNEVEIDTRTDVYALGVILYELATGFLPISPDQWYIKSLDEMLDIIINKPAPKPSELLKDSKDQLAEILPNRATTYAKLYRAIKGDLDWIILKAVEKDKNRRYSTAAELQNEIDNYLKGMPVIAGPPGVGYQFKKLVQRNKLPVAAFSLFMLALIGGIVGTTQGFLEAKKEAKSTQQTLDLLQEFLVSPKPGNQGRDLKVTELLETFAEKLEQDQESIDPLVLATLKRTIGSTYQNLGAYREAEKVWQDAVDILERNSLMHTRLYWRAKGNLANIFLTLNKVDKAEQTYIKLINFLETQYGENSTPTVLNKIALTELYFRTDRIELTEQFNVMMEKNRKLLLDESPDDYYIGMRLQSRILSKQAKYKEALALDLVVADYFEKTYKSNHPEAIKALTSIANKHYAIGSYEDAYEIEKKLIPIAEKTLGKSHPSTISIYKNFAITLIRKNDYESAIQILHNTLESTEATYGISHPNYLNTQKNLARAYLEINKTKTALDILSDISSKFAQPDISNILKLDTLRLTYIAELKIKQNQTFYENLKNLLTQATKQLGPTHPLTLKIESDTLENTLIFEPKSFLESFLSYHKKARSKYGPDSYLIIKITNNFLDLIKRQNLTTLLQNLIGKLTQTYNLEYQDNKKTVNTFIQGISPQDKEEPIKEKD